MGIIRQTLKGIGTGQSQFLLLFDATSIRHSAAKKLAMSANCVGLASYTPAMRTSTARVIRSPWFAALPVRFKLDRRTAAISRVARISFLPL